MKLQLETGCLSGEKGCHTARKFRRSVLAAAATLCPSCMSHSFHRVILNAEIANQIVRRDFHSL